MSTTPVKRRKLTRLKVEEISICKRGANKHARILITKSADEIAKEKAARWAPCNSCPARSLGGGLCAVRARCGMENDVKTKGAAQPVKKSAAVTAAEVALRRRFRVADPETLAAKVEKSGPPVTAVQHAEVAIARAAARDRPSTPSATAARSDAPRTAVDIAAGIIARDAERLARLRRS